MKKILVVVAHPDDEVLGCGGTIARLKNEGNDIYTMILGEGVTSRDIAKNSAKEKLNELHQDAKRANDILGVREVIFSNLPDNKFDTIPLLDIVKIVEKEKNNIKPDIIFTHFRGDLNIDHQITYKAVITATRPIKGETVKEIYSFEVLSSTEWAYPISFSPNVFYDISKTINDKLIAMASYESELRKDYHPRSLSGIWCSARLWGQKVGIDYAEAFECIRIVK